MRLLFIIAFIISCCSTYGQKTLARQLKHADSVLLISHSLPAGVSDAHADSSVLMMILPELISNGKLNRELVVESKTLSPGETTTLIKTLTYQYHPGKNNISSCFTPHHAIVIITKETASLIELCFHCQEYETTSDITGLEIRLDKWAKLHKLFKAHGFKYEMDLD